QHFDLGEALEQMDFELAAKLSGARFVVLQKGLARLERALGQFMLDVHTGKEHAYTEVNPPLLVRDHVIFGTAQLPKFSDDQFAPSKQTDIQQSTLQKIKLPASRSEETQKFDQQNFFSAVGEALTEVPLEDSFWLIPTAEVPLTNLVRESIV